MNLCSNLLTFSYSQEILQNAEDARATTVKLLYDETCHQTIFDLGKDELRVSLLPLLLSEL